MHPRHMKLLDLICQNGRLAVTELSAKLGVSEVTIRKDLNMLAHQGLLKREHGFACMVASDDIGHHLSFHYENKRRIAERAARCVQPGETVMIESGSCCTLLAEELCARDCHITIITNSAFIASFVHKMRSARIILLGGSYQNEAQVMVGPLVGLCARNFKVDKFFLGIDGMDERGVKSSDHLRIEAAQAMAAQARGIIVLTESVKFHRDASAPSTPTQMSRTATSSAARRSAPRSSRPQSAALEWHKKDLLEAKLPAGLSFIS